MHSLLVFPILMGAVMAQIHFSQIHFPQYQGPYPSRPVYPAGQLPGHRPVRPVHRPVTPAQQPGFPAPQPGLPLPNPGLPVQPVPQPGFPVEQPELPSRSNVHHSLAGSDYHFSWRVPDTGNFEWAGAREYCATLPGGNWQAISIETSDEDNWVASVLQRENQKYIWTSGFASPHPNFVWGTGQRVTSLNWSHTGSKNVPQPDNAEDNIENCLAVLNNFYGDGVRWHDVACYHPKPVICERKPQLIG